MAGPDKSRHHQQSPTASSRTGNGEEAPDIDPPPRDFSDPTGDINAFLDRAEATMTLVSAWTENYANLVQLEFQRTLGAGKRILGLLLLLFFLVIALVESLCAGLGLLGYYFFNSIYIGFGIFVLAQLLIVAAILLSLNRLRAMLGFEESRKQAQQALNDVTALFKQPN